METRIRLDASEGRVRLARGTVVLVGLDPTHGHEQRGTRPCVLVSDPEASEDQRFPMVCVIPLTGTRGEGALYPRISAGASGLIRDSYALVDQVRAVDKRRVTRIFGPVDPPDLEAIDEGLRLLLGL